MSEAIEHGILCGLGVALVMLIVTIGAAWNARKEPNQ